MDDRAQCTEQRGTEHRAPSTEHRLLTLGLFAFHFSLTSAAFHAASYLASVCTNTSLTSLASSNISS